MKKEIQTKYKDQKKLTPYEELIHSLKHAYDHISKPNMNSKKQFI